MRESNKRLIKKKNDIAKVGAGLFSRQGFAETSMQDVAAAARLSKGGIYHYFLSKTELLYFILDNFMDLVLADLRKEIDMIDDSLEKVKRLIFRHVALYPKHMDEARTLFHEVQNLPSESYKKLIAKEREYYRITAEVLGSFFGRSVDKNEITAMTFILLGMCNSIYAWYNPKNPVSPRQLSQIIFDILTDGFSGYQKRLSGKLKLKI